MALSDVDVTNKSTLDSKEVTSLNICTVAEEDKEETDCRAGNFLSLSQDTISFQNETSSSSSSLTVLMVTHMMTNVLHQSEC